MKHLKYFILSVIVIVSFNSCKNRDMERNVEVKIIQYDVTYINKNAGSIPTKILPNKMTLIMGDDYAMNSIEGFLGQFSLIYIANLKRKKVTTLLKLFDKKYYYEGNLGELPIGIDEMKSMILKPTGQKRTILDFEANEYDIENVGIDGMKVYSTDEIRVKSPNGNTPYKLIDEVLLQFYTKLSVLEMYLTAESYDLDSASIKIFAVPDDYILVPKLKMEKTLSELFK